MHPQQDIKINTTIGLDFKEEELFKGQYTALKLTSDIGNYKEDGRTFHLSLTQIGENFYKNPDVETLLRRKYLNKVVNTNNQCIYEVEIRQRFDALGIDTSILVALLATDWSEDIDTEFVGTVKKKLDQHINWFTNIYRCNKHHNSQTDLVRTGLTFIF
ncbi:MAG: hypothetical protein OMM_06051 [Candidatus Magnetoglobus multicellularis str. Araruama]|uniref:Uncharacterized protein n=1 Tax=Candidatus Magnetoglobus multicellularis str. Araruama TaxID=890399 RepID=A0A1V1NS61_9BACT|nr:MAG: hypothetical protein OMM_06051 [Candidatus Magnetoglobus multicellularis str. Araruama]